MGDAKCISLSFFSLFFFATQKKGGGRGSSNSPPKRRLYRQRTETLAWLWTTRAARETRKTKRKNKTEFEMCEPKKKRRAGTSTAGRVP